MPAGGGSPAYTDATDPDADYPQSVRFPWAAVLTGVDGNGATFADFDNSFTVHDKMLDASKAFGGSPYQLVSAFDPTDDLDSIGERADEFFDAVDALDPEVDLETAVAQAVTLFDANIDVDQRITDAIAAEDARTKARHMREISRVFTGMYEIRAIMGTQVMGAVASIEQERSDRLADYSAKLRMFQERERTQGILALTEQRLAQLDQQLRMEQGAATLQTDVARIRVLAHQDATDTNIEYEVKDALWDLELFQYHSQVMGSISGGMVQRPQTVRERQMAALMLAGSAGIQAGSALRSPAAGIGFGLFTLAAQLYGIG